MAKMKTMSVRQALALGNHSEMVKEINLQVVSQARQYVWGWTMAP